MTTIDVLVTESKVVEVVTVGPQGPRGAFGASLSITSDVTQDGAVGAYFSDGDNEITMLDHNNQIASVMVKNRSGTLTLTNPFGNIILPGITAPSVTLTASQSYILWPTELGWEYNG